MRFVGDEAEDINKIMKPHVYVETSVIRYLTARPSRNLLTLARPQVTADWWDLHSVAFDAHVSLLVIDEVACGDAAAASRRLLVCAPLPPT